MSLFLLIITYRRMEEEDVISDSTFVCVIAISYRRMEENDVIVDRTLLTMF